MTSLTYLDAAALDAAASWPLVIDALDEALLAGVNPAATPPRLAPEVSGGGLLLMAAESPTAVGVKVLSVAPGNPQLNLPFIQGLCLLFDTATLTPYAVVDGGALTRWRTAGLSALVVRETAPADASRLVVFGTGVQARAHLEAIAAVRPIRQARIVGRTPQRSLEFCQQGGPKAVSVEPGSIDDVTLADIVVCATTSAEPLFEAAALPDRCVVLAIGAYEPNRRELSSGTYARASRTIVEDRGTALREAADLVRAQATGQLDVATVIGVAEAGWRGESDGIVIYRAFGMAWEDVVVAAALAPRRCDTEG